MADLAAQREARRRKITQNAEARMNRLLGIGDGKSSPEPETSKSTSTRSSTTTPSELTEVPSDVPSQPVPTSQCGDETSQCGDETSQCGDETSQCGDGDQTDVQSASPSPYNLRHRSARSSSSVVTQADTERTTNNNSTSDRPHEEPITTRQELRREIPNVIDARSAKVQAPEDGASQTQSGINDAQTFHLVHMSACVIAAFLARFVLKFGIGLFYFETILLPFIAGQLLLSYLKRTHLKHMTQPAPSGTMWSTALVLCGIRQDLISHYNVIMARITSVVSDFCLYLFAFILFNAVIG